MDEDRRTYRMNEATGEWERVPEREPIIANWDALWIFVVTIASGLIASAVVKLLIWNS